MPKISYAIERRDVDANLDESILQVSLRAGIPHANACGGNARCSTCRVAILDGLEHCGTRSEREQALAEMLHFSPEIRLACQTRITDDVRLRRLVLDDDDMELTDQLGGSVSCAVGEEKRLAVLFSDIRSFTPFAEALPAYDVVHVLNRFFRHMERAITRNEGEINNYMGDGLMALFGLHDHDGAPLQAVNAGLQMIDEMEHLKPYLTAIYGRAFEVGIGIHCGEVVVGSIGSGNTSRITAIGDVVNLASRIESANKQAGTRLLISQDTFNLVAGSITVGKVIQASLQGKSGEYALYEVTGVKIG